MKTLEELTGDSSWIRIKCPICAQSITLDSNVYSGYEGIIRCHGGNLHNIYVKLGNCKLLEPPQPIYIDNPEFKSPPIPKKILENFKEATICFANNASNACVVMCGRVLEGLTIDQKAEGKSLSEKIKHLYDSNMISKPLYEAFTKVRTFRNIGAHFQITNEIEKGEDKKILDITKHIVEHIYILPQLCK